jgi:hypothetical protein
MRLLKQHFFEKLFLLFEYGYEEKLFFFAKVSGNKQDERIMERSSINSERADWVSSE